VFSYISLLIETINADDLSRKWTDSDAVRRRQETLLINTQKQIRELQSIVLAKEYQLKQLTGDSKGGDGTTDDAAFTQAMESMKDTYEKAIEQQKFENGKLAAEVDRLQRICRLNNISED
jgi:hypothetical protein